LRGCRGVACGDPCCNRRETSQRGRLHSPRKTRDGIFLIVGINKILHLLRLFTTSTFVNQFYLLCSQFIGAVIFLSFKTILKEPFGSVSVANGQTQLKLAKPSYPTISLEPLQSKKSYKKTDARAGERRTDHFR
jgi:hypothetical protein